MNITHPPVAGPNDATKQVSKTVYEQPHEIDGTPGSVLYVGAGPVVAEDNANFKWGTAAGQGLTANAGTATTDVGFRFTQAWGNAALAFKGYEYVINDQASNVLSIHSQWLGGAGGTTPFCQLTKGGILRAKSMRVHSTNDGFVVSNSDVLGEGNVHIFLGNSGSFGQLLFGRSTSSVIGFSAGDVFSPDFAITRDSAGRGALGTSIAGGFAGSLKLTNLIEVGRISANGSFGGAGQVLTSHAGTPDTWETPTGVPSPTDVGAVLFFH